MCHTEQTIARHAQNLIDLQLDYVDNLLVHFPCDWNETPATCNPQARQDEWRGWCIVLRFVFVLVMCFVDAILYFFIFSTFFWFLCSFILSPFVLFCLFCFVCFVLFRFVLFCFVLFCFVLFCSVVVVVVVARLYSF
jgi:hypothetical protein